MVNGAKGRLNGGTGDCYYIPTSTAKEWVELVPIFLDNNIFLEVAVPTILQCLAPPQNREIMTPLMLWENDRTKLWELFNALDMMNVAFVHPTKWSDLSHGEKGHVRLFCRTLMFLHDPNGQIMAL